MKHLLIYTFGLVLCIQSQGEEVIGVNYSYMVPSNTSALVIEDAVDWFRFDWSTGGTNSTLVLHPHEDVNTEAQSITAARKLEAASRKEALRLKSEMDMRVTREPITIGSLRGSVLSLYIRPVPPKHESWQHHLYLWDGVHPLFGLLMTDSPDAMEHALTIIKSRKLIANKASEDIDDRPPSPQR